ncbi:MAG: response regulator [Proteobacteria bacterium]|nr:response regulator [Pseudomonadota bacterium]
MEKILIVEDQLEVQKLLEMLLRGEGRQLQLTESGEEAVKMAQEFLPDVILLDVMLPGGMNGYEVARILKKDPATVGCAIIIMTAKVQEEDKVEAFDAGADDFIGKPFRMLDLKNKIARFLE